LQLTLEENLRKSIASDFENQLLMLQNSVNASAEKLKESRQKELEFLQREQSLKQKEEEMEIALQRKLQEQRAELERADP
jgi:hypothetical protein